MAPCAIDIKDKLPIVPKPKPLDKEASGLKWWCTVLVLVVCFLAIPLGTYFILRSARPRVSWPEIGASPHLTSPGPTISSETTTDLASSSYPSPFAQNSRIASRMTEFYHQQRLDNRQNNRT